MVEGGSGELEDGQLPSLETVRERALAGVGGDGVNVLAHSLEGDDLLSAVDRATIEPEDGGPERDAYVGTDGARAGLLAAAATVTADSDARLHYPEAEFDLTAEGPWLVLEPLGGRLGTVSRGRATVTVTLERSAGNRVADDHERVGSVLEAAQPDHEYYPVDDDLGVFTTGMTTFALESMQVADETMVVAFDVRTTPATKADAVEARFEDCSGVTNVRLERLSGVQRAVPDPAVREAAEAAHVSIVGDDEYAWLPPTAPFTAVPSPNKLALGTGAAGQSFDAEDVETCRRLLERTIETLEMGAKGIEGSR
ncbi:hypothetical protein ACLI4Q_02840 [Natrialbaceae archaeon A-CW1-1]